MRTMHNKTLRTLKIMELQNVNEKYFVVMNFHHKIDGNAVKVTVFYKQERKNFSRLFVLIAADKGTKNR